MPREWIGRFTVRVSMVLNLFDRQEKDMPGHAKNALGQNVRFC